MRKNYSDESLSEPKTFKVTSRPINQSYECPIDDYFEHVSQFEDIVFILENAEEGDLVKLNLSSGGGSLAAVIPLLAAMEICKAHIHCHIITDIASACTFIPMYSDSVEVNPYSTIMFHNIQYGTSGTGHIVKDYVDYTDAASKRLLNDMYADFLEEDEMSSLLNGKEIWMDAEEYQIRYELMKESRGKAYEDALKQAVA